MELLSAMEPRVMLTGFLFDTMWVQAIGHGTLEATLILLSLVSGIDKRHLSMGHNSECSSSSEIRGSPRNGMKKKHVTQYHLFPSMIIDYIYDYLSEVLPPNAEQQLKKKSWHYLHLHS